MRDINSYDVQDYDYRVEIKNLRVENQKLRREILEYQQSYDRLKNELDSIIYSRSWKLTKPLRFLNSSFKKNKNNHSESIRLLHLPENEKAKSNYDGIPVYQAEYQNDQDYSKFKTDIKTLVFYLPQFHEFKENNEWWGKGFMEWTNTKKAKPRFKGHYQPRIPHDDFGYYTLDNVETIKKQVNLAKRHGIYGFCFYYYWFSGKRLMEKPIDLFLNDKSINYPFCLCWANENWTRTWDGLETDILIKQDYTKKDQINFIKDAKKYLEDERYIRIDDKPLIMIYNPYSIPEFENVIKNWRKAAKEIGIGDICIWCKTDLANEENKFTDFVDGEFDFPPLGIGHEAVKIKGLPSPKIFNYEKIVTDIEHLYREHFPLKPFYYTCTMGWDNSARKKENYTIYYNYSLESYYKWLRILIEETRRRHAQDKRFLLINAWNEWAEGTYLEPDKKYGYANINTLSKAIFNIPLEKNEKNKKL